MGRRTNDRETCKPINYKILNKRGTIAELRTSPTQTQKIQGDSRQERITIFHHVITSLSSNHNLNQPNG